VSAFVADPSVTDSTSEIELGFFGHQEHAPATGTIRPAKIQRGSRFGGAGALDAHRRLSSTEPSPASPSTVRWELAESLWRRCDVFVKLSCSLQRNRIDKIESNPARQNQASRAARGQRRPYSAACACACCWNFGITSSARSRIASRSQAWFGPAQSSPVISKVPNGPTSSRNATSLSSSVLGEP
jgi:hypothetical protein